jgi:hypothetical protein
MKCNCAIVRSSFFPSFSTINKVHACIISKKAFAEVLHPIFIPNWTMAQQIIIAKICNDTHHIANQSEMELVLESDGRTSNHIPKFPSWVPWKKTSEFEGREWSWGRLEARHHKRGSFKRLMSGKMFLITYVQNLKICTSTWKKYACT